MTWFHGQIYNRHGLPQESISPTITVDTIIPPMYGEVSKVPSHENLL
eukprot:CAMPEP_0196580040 /NCGR_PEP_ID=MMETSP1081-20130531/26552_1 /TAXON_ID=36882 /ORGANISM="Pyramimonas amylifera, Strain CCMP720" /LENGTH=46 /DNA_ID= /DNA_START= /DNA_END= /DNA_ORIENTATION=